MRLKELGGAILYDCNCMPFHVNFTISYLLYPEIHTHTHTHTHICIYIERERENEVKVGGAMMGQDETRTGGAVPGTPNR